MLTFEMNAGNFGSYLGGGQCAGTRLLATGVALDLVEHAGDWQTLGLWHLHDKVWSDASGNGHGLSGQNGAGLDDYGAVLVRASSQYGSATGLNLRGYGAVTLEAWFELARLPAVGEYFTIASQYENLRAYLDNSGGTYRLLARVVEQKPGGGSQLQVAIHSFAAPPEAGRWYHVAVVWEQGVALRLWLDGVLAATKAPLTGLDFNYTQGDFYVGAAPNGNYLDGRIDEARVSRTARYTAAFEPKRYVATGTFTSPAFDGERAGCRWLELEWTGQTPGTTGLAMEQRTGEALDGQGQVVGAWGPAEGDPPYGRYMQWRAALARSTDAQGLATPLLEEVTATASEEGYNVYHGSGSEAWAIDYGSPVARLGPVRVSYDATGLASGAVHWFGVRSVNAWGGESQTVDAEARLEVDGSGERVAARPAGVESLEAFGAGAGKVRLAWLALAEQGEAAPTAFRVYTNGGSGEIDFETPAGEVVCETGRREYEWTSGELADGLVVRFAVRAETAEGGVDASPAEVEVTVDAEAPRAAGYVSATTALSD